MYIHSEKEVLLNKSKKLASLFLYGQTVNPIEILAKGSYEAIVLFLKPSGIKSLFGIEASELRDDCLDLSLIPYLNIAEITEKMQELLRVEEKIALLCDLLLQVITRNKLKTDQRVEFAAKKIIQSKGNLPLTTLHAELGITERTFERKFKEYVGITPSLFARICKFQSVLGQMEQEDYTKLSDLAYDFDFADQSHFIRTFKEFTGLTPSEYKAMMK